MLKHIQMTEQEREALFTKISMGIREAHKRDLLAPKWSMPTDEGKACGGYWLMSLFGKVDSDWYEHAITKNEDAFDHTPFFAEDLAKLSNAFEYTSEDPDKADEILLNFLMPARITAFQEELLTILNLRTD